MQSGSNHTYLVTLYQNLEDSSELFHRYFLFKNMIEASGIEVVTVECERDDLKAAKWPINSNVKYRFSKFNYFEAMVKGVEALPKNWEKVLFVDMNIEFLDYDFASKIEKSFNNNQIIQLFEKCVTINPLSEQIIDTNFSLIYGKKFPIDKNYFSLWFADPGCAWGMKRSVFEAIKNEILHIKGEVFSNSILSYCVANKVEKVYEQSEKYQNLQNILQSFSNDSVNNTIFKYVKSDLCQYENFLRELSLFETVDTSTTNSLSNKQCGIYPELKCKFDMLDYVIDLNETLAQGKMLKNIWSNISSMSIESVSSQVSSKNKRDPVTKNEKIMTIELNMNSDDNSTIISDSNYSETDSNISANFDDDFYDNIDKNIVFSNPEMDKLMYQYGACQMKCKMNVNDSDDNIRYNQQTVKVVETINVEENNNFQSNYNAEYKAEFNNNFQNNFNGEVNRVDNYHTKVNLEVKIEENQNNFGQGGIESKQQTNNNFNTQYNNTTNVYNNQVNEVNVVMNNNNNNNYNYGGQFNAEVNLNVDYNAEVVMDNNQETFKDNNNNYDYDNNTNNNNNNYNNNYNYNYNYNYESNQDQNDPPVIIENRQESFANAENNKDDYNHPPAIVEDNRPGDESSEDYLPNNDENQNNLYANAQQNQMNLDDSDEDDQDCGIIDYGDHHYMAEFNNNNENNNENNNFNYNYNNNDNDNYNNNNNIAQNDDENYEVEVNQDYNNQANNNYNYNNQTDDNYNYNSNNNYNSNYNDNNNYNYGGDNNNGFNLGVDVNVNVNVDVEVNNNNDYGFASAQQNVMSLDF